MNTRYEIVFAINAEYLPHLSTALLSLLTNNSNERLSVSIINSDIQAQDFSKIEKMTCNFDCALHDVKVPVETFEGLPIGHHLEKSTYYRLLIPKLINADRVLYLDADLIVLNSIAKLLRCELGSRPVAAVENPGFGDRKFALGMSKTAAYLNAGVMVMNLKYWRELEVSQKIIDFIANNPEVIEFADQCGINAVLNGNWLALPPEYNVQHTFFGGKLPDKYKSIQPILDKAAIMHFTGGGKPWHMLHKHPYKKLYWFYRKKTPYKSLLPDDFSCINLLRYISRNYIKKFAKTLSLPIKKS